MDPQLETSKTPLHICNKRHELGAPTLLLIPGMDDTVRTGCSLNFGEPAFLLLTLLPRIFQEYFGTYQENVNTGKVGKD